MGLDSVEIVLRAEEVFGVDLPDEECGQVRTVGDLYRLVLSKLALPYQTSLEIEEHALGRTRIHAGMGSLAPWTTPDVWSTLKRIIEDQLQVNPEDVRESATFLDDLRCD